MIKNQLKNCINSMFRPFQFSLSQKLCKNFYLHVGNILKIYFTRIENPDMSLLFLIFTSFVILLFKISFFIIQEFPYQVMKIKFLWGKRWELYGDQYEENSIIHFEWILLGGKRLKTLGFCKSPGAFYTKNFLHIINNISMSGKFIQNSSKNSD
jgi:hypothetical protein